MSEHEAAQNKPFVENTTTKALGVGSEGSAKPASTGSQRYTHSEHVEMLRGCLNALDSMGPKWRDAVIQGDLALNSLEEEYERMQNEFARLWQEQEHPFDKSEYDRLFEQLEAARKALALVVAYDDAVIEWDTTRASDVGHKEKIRLSDRATELNKQAFPAARAALAAVSSPAISPRLESDPDTSGASAEGNDAGSGAEKSSPAERPS